ncbi:MAG TPA: DNA-formamidopyrimidine glycosylase family protein [Methanomassiliicoccales archaeon]|nr:DNA-formamidopyrimidine glycosylase family protein [Methanomassiliicoccales archaeon]
MPELPEVETARRQLHEELVGQRIVRADALDLKMLVGGNAKEFSSRLEGRLIVGTDRHGKHLFLLLDHGALRIHLGMSGSLHPFRCGGETSHQRMVLDLDRGRVIFDDPRRFGRFQVVENVMTFVSQKGLGPDALSIGEGEFHRRICRRRRAIKAVLLDQKVVAGIGNLYADEVLFQERLAPMALASQIPQDRLMGAWSRMREVLGTAIEAGTEFERFPADYLLRQRNRGGPCPRCGQELRSAKVGGRTTIYCPFCLLK